MIVQNHTEKFPRSCCLCRWGDTVATYGPIIHPPHYMSMENYGGMILTGQNGRTWGGGPLPVQLCPPQILHGLTQDSVVRGRRLTA
jgi:hypothetical protein